MILFPDSRRVFFLTCLDSRGGVAHLPILMYFDGSNASTSPCRLACLNVLARDIPSFRFAS